MKMEKIRCEKCEGTGIYTISYGYDSDCSHCRGRGFILRPPAKEKTAEDVTLMAILQKNGIHELAIDEVADIKKAMQEYAELQTSELNRRVRELEAANTILEGALKFRREENERLKKQ